MAFIYNVLFTVLFLLAAPYYFYRMWRRGNWKKGFAQRFGKYDGKLKMALTNRHTVWIHAVSVGEVNIATQLIKAFESRVPNLKIVVSTTTSTGMGELKKKLPSHVMRVYYPIDRKKFVQRAMAILKPEAIILVEAEIWPNFLWQAKSRNIPVFIVNGRLSAKSYRRYRLFGFLFRGLFRSFKGVGVQNEQDADRFRKLGCGADVMHVVGNLKFDAAMLGERPLINPDVLLKQLGISPEALVLIGGSTHPGEEGVLADLYLKLKPRFPSLFLVLVPRHFERGREVGNELEKKGLKFIYRTEMSGSTSYKPGEIDCLLVNTTGELRHLYSVGSVIFMGKSLTAAGGQSPVEPAALGKAVVFGPNMQNFEAIAEAFVEGKGALQVKDALELQAAVEKLLHSEDARNDLGKNALQVVAANQGSIDRTMNMILPHLEGGELYFTPTPTVGRQRRH